jgi:hypothetical protein
MLDRIGHVLNGPLVLCLSLLYLFLCPYLILLVALPHMLMTGEASQLHFPRQLGQRRGSQVGDCIEIWRYRWWESDGRLRRERFVRPLARVWGLWS